MPYKLFLFLTIVSSVFDANSQNVGIGTNSPHSSAILEVSSSDKRIINSTASAEKHKRSALDPITSYIVVNLQYGYVCSRSECSNTGVLLLGR
jgi:hypothetical protein